MAHGTILFGLMYLAYLTAPSEPDGSSGSLWEKGAAVNAVLVIVVNAKVRHVRLAFSCGYPSCGSGIVGMHCGM
jgi:hypothetical protein